MKGTQGRAGERNDKVKTSTGGTTSETINQTIERNKTMSNQIKLNDGETLTWAIYENGSGVLSLVLFAETLSDALPVAAVFDILPDNVLPALDDLDMIDMWQGVNYDVADIHRFLRDEAARPVAYTQVPRTGEIGTIMEIERMGYAARKAFNIADE
jgi:hypothetical protein